MRNAIFDPEDYVKNGGTIIDFNPEEKNLIKYQPEKDLMKYQRKAGLIIAAAGILFCFVFWPLGFYFLVIGIYSFWTDKTLIKAKE